MLVGYMRVSTDGDRQVLDLQRDALIAAGVDERHLFEDRVSVSEDVCSSYQKSFAVAARSGGRGAPLAAGVIASW
jgi:DNA invertase Pin-like site-specific DNA recombinase